MRQRLLRSVAPSSRAAGSAYSTSLLVPIGGGGDWRPTSPWRCWAGAPGTEPPAPTCRSSLPTTPPTACTDGSGSPRYTGTGTGWHQVRAEPGPRQRCVRQFGARYVCDSSVNVLALPYWSSQGARSETGSQPEVLTGSETCGRTQLTRGFGRLAGSVARPWHQRRETQRARAAYAQRAVASSELRTAVDGDR